MNLDGVLLHGADVDESVAGHAAADAFGDGYDDDPDLPAEDNGSELDRANRTATEVGLDEEAQ